ncbi:hypothetical protein ABMA27_008847 [Loxostege sticticalis]|uniref:Regulatory protein zeste n=1 Tax=Loxostege sticticalis TaxID=481309 RepID=A0ABR3H9A3_LOXSC
MSAPPTAEQIEMLLNFLQEHQDLARGHLRDVSGRAQTRDLWLDLANNGNACGGTVKAVKQWQRVWADRKYLAKKAASASRQSASATGGGPSTAPPISDTDRRIISIMGEGFGSQQVEGRVPAFYPLFFILFSG